jgi:hypothetical protein
MSRDTGSTAMPEIVFDHTVGPDRRIMIVDSFGQRVQMSVDQFRRLSAEGVSDLFLTLATIKTPRDAQSGPRR